ncbi:MAG: chemotaxis protein CheW [Bacteroidota bacterium]|nr:chemotaxis protein CheW [Bacteroidota bacterium]
MEKNKSEKINSYLTFILGNELFAANVKNVLHILPIQNITSVPNSPDYMKGVINLRGQVLAVIDAKEKFNMKKTDTTKNTCIIVFEIELDDETINIGAIVDSVNNVLKIDDKNIKPPPAIGEKYKSEFIEGVIKHQNDFIILLNINKLFSTDEVSILKK